MEWAQAIGSLPRDTLTSLQFLSRLPVWRLVKLDMTPDFGSTAHAFPIAGALIGLFAWFVLTPFLYLETDAPLAALSLLACLMLMTGALHEDGLADVADGFWGGHTRERKLEIMRDSTIGTYGTLALLVVTGARWWLWAALLGAVSGVELALLIVAICGLSRAAMLVPWIALPAARPAKAATTGGKDGSGLSVRYGEPDRQTGILAALICIPLVVVVVAYGAPLMLVSLLAGIAATYLLARHHIGGHTGDVLGATQQMAEVGLLFGFALAM